MRDLTVICFLLFVIVTVVSGQWDPDKLEEEKEKNNVDDDGPKIINSQKYCGSAFCSKSMNIPMPNWPNGLRLLEGRSKVETKVFVGYSLRGMSADESCLCYRGVDHGKECDTSEDCTPGNTCVENPFKNNASFCYNDTDLCGINRGGLCHLSSKPVYVNNTCLCRCKEMVCNPSYYNQYCALRKDGKVFDWANECLFYRQHCNLTTVGTEALYTIHRHCSTIPSGDINYAVGGRTLQSSTQGLYESRLAIDDSNQTTVGSLHCAQTERELTGKPYLRVLLKDGIERDIFRISILFPTGCPACISDLQHARIRLWTSTNGLYPKPGDKNTLLDMVSSLTDGSNARVFNFHPISRGNLVEIEAVTANKQLTICEVQVFSHPDYTRLD